MGLTLGILGLLNIEPWGPSEPTTVLLPGLAILYLVIGAVRGELRRPGILLDLLVGAALIAAPLA